jgi:adenylate cyclase
MQPQDPAESVENQPIAPVYRLDDLIVDTGRVRVTRADRELALPKLSFDLLVALIEAAPRVVSPDELMERVWPGLIVSPETLSQRVKLLRDALGDDPKQARYIAGVRGRGYRLNAAVVVLKEAGEMRDRRIAAILAADVVDYSRLMGVDEESALAGLKLRRSIFDRLVADAGGHEFGCVGDSLMAEFPSAVNAVRCAQAIQQRIAEENAPLPPDRRMHLRIGVNLGDVIEEGGAAIGDAVNIAARLQSIAKPGGVLISGPVYDQVRNKIPANFIDAGARQVKNIAEPVRTFQVLPAELPGFAGRLSGFFARMASRPMRRGAAAVAALVIALLAFGWYTRGWQAREAHVPAAEPSPGAIELPSRSIAVLAFENRGGAPGTGILAEGIPETVLHQLARLPGLTVIARGSSFAFQGRREDLRVIGRKLNVRYLLEGSVQTAGDRLRVMSSLVDAQTGASVWSRQFDPQPQDIFAMQDEIALEVARSMRIMLDAASGAAATLQRGATENYEAYLAFLRGRALLASLRVAELPAAVDSLTTATRLDPKFASAYVLLAQAKVAHSEQIAAGDSLKSFPDALNDAMQLLDKAIGLDPLSGEAFVERGYLKAYFDIAGADADFRRGLELAPNHARGYEGLATVLFQSVARRREALEMIEKARRLDPLELRLDVIKATYLVWGSGDFRQAAQVLEAVLERDPLYVPALVRLSEVRWVGQGEHAESVALGEQAVALDAGNESAWRQLAANYLSVAEPAAAEAALRHLADPPAYSQLWMSLYRKEWRKAGEAAYALIEAGPTYSQIESQLALAIRRHARVTGEYRRAIETLENWASVTWEGNEPVLQGQLDMGLGVAGLADMLMASGQHQRARTLLEELLADVDLQIKRYGRGEVWLNDSRAIAFALLGRPKEAVAVLQRQARLGFLNHHWRILLEDEPAFDSLRERKDFRALLAEVRANEAREHEQLLRMRADGQVPDRR